jgi:branched-chain amino acid aminotransferase
MQNLDIPVTKNLLPKTKPDENALGFGKYFSDHMFTAKYAKAKGWFNPQVIPYQPLPMDPAASVLHYGQALFEGMKAFRQQNEQCVLFRPEFNWQRMVAGAERLCMQAPPKDFFLEGVKAVVRADRDWIPTKMGSSLYIRPTLIGTEAFLGVRPAEEHLFFIILSPVGSYYAEAQAPVKIWIEEEFLRAGPGGLGATKAAANYATSLKAAYQAKQKGYAQVLWLDIHREYIEEVGTMNVFFVFKNEIVTPSLDGTILDGGIRSSVIEILKSWNLPIVERKLKLEEVIAASQTGDLQEAFGTGTAAVISPIGELASAHRKVSLNSKEMGPVASRLYEEITSLQYGLKPDARGWIERI